MHRPALNRRNARSAVRTVAVSVLGLTPMVIVSGLMLAQILGLWTY